MKINASDAETYYNMGCTHIRKGLNDQAISDFNKALEINPEFADAYYNRGLSHASQKRGLAYAIADYDQAISDFSKALEINPKHVNAYYSRGIAYNTKGLYDQAISDFSKALEINPKYVNAYYSRGIAYNTKGLYDQAISDFNKVLEINPEFAKAYYNRGIAYKTKGLYNQANSDFNKAREINPEREISLHSARHIERLHARRPKLIDVSEIVKDELKKLSFGHILFNTSEEMIVGVRERVEVRIAKIITENLFKGLRGRGVPQIEEIRVSTFMKVCLRGNNFDIKKLSHEEQLVAGEEFTQWDWDVVPLKSGIQLLLLTVTIRIKIPTYSEERKDYPVFERQIKVKINPIYSTIQFINSYWQWIIGVIISSGVIGWVIKNWLD